MSWDSVKVRVLMFYMISINIGLAENIAANVEVIKETLHHGLQCLLFLRQEQTGRKIISHTNILNNGKYRPMYFWIY